MWNVEKHCNLPHFFTEQKYINMNMPGIRHGAKVLQWYVL